MTRSISTALILLALAGTAVAQSSHQGTAPLPPLAPLHPWARWVWAR